MNTLLIVALAVVAFCYCGGKYCPSVLKQNKEMLLGVLVGMALCSFAGLRMEGYTDDCDITDFSKLLGGGQSCNNDCQCTSDLLCIDGKCGRKTRTPSAAASDERTHNNLCSHPDLKEYACSGGAGSNPDWWNTECPQNRCP